MATLRQKIVRNKWGILFATWGIVIVTLHVKHILEPQELTPKTGKQVIVLKLRSRGDKKVLSADYKPVLGQVETNTSSLQRLEKGVTPIRPDDPTGPLFQKPNISVRYYDVVLSSYMRSGSTLTGIVLGWRDDTFYVYEPLWKTARWVYFHGNFSVCRSDKPNCRRIDPGKAIQDKSFVDNMNRNVAPASLVLARKMLNKVYDCLFNEFDNQIMQQGLTEKLGGPSWEQVSKCMKGKSENQKQCMFRFAPNKCKNAHHKVTKVLRLTVDNFEPLLASRYDIKVIHLFRDPRAIINSRITTSWFPTGTDGQIHDNARALCTKMLYDYKAGRELMIKFPGRFRFIYYEDLNDEPLAKVKGLYRYLGMSLDEGKYQTVRKLPVFQGKGNSERQNNTAYWWRKSMSWNIVKKIDDICAETYKALGYKVFDNEDHLRNLTLPSLKIPQVYVLETAQP